MRTCKTRNDYLERVHVKPLLDEQETTENGKELNKAIVDGRKNFKRREVRHENSVLCKHRGNLR